MTWPRSTTAPAGSPRSPRSFALGRLLALEASPSGEAVWINPSAVAYLVDASAPDGRQILLFAANNYVEGNLDAAVEFLRKKGLADAGIDSLDALTILFAIEEHFRITIPDERARSMTTFGDMVDVVESLVAASK